ncbi:MAG: hypothetical protein R6V10_14440 [bacterium]
MSATDSITDVPGVKVGHYSDYKNGTGADNDDLHSFPLFFCPIMTPATQISTVIFGRFGQYNKRSHLVNRKSPAGLDNINNSCYEEYAGSAALVK